nr:hypothetical protein [Tanacetum cinerariifolium]
MLHHNLKRLTHLDKPKKGQDTKVPQSSGPPKKVGDEVVYTGKDDRVVRAATTTTSLEAGQENDAHTRFETVSIQSHDPPLSEVNTSGSGEDSVTHHDDLTDFVPPTPYDLPLLGGHTPGSDEGMNLFKIGTFRRKSLDKENVSKLKRNLKTRIKEGNFDDDFDDIDDVVDKAMKNVERDTVNAAIRVSATSASVTTAGVSISTAEPRTPLTITTKAFEDEDLTIAQTLVKMRSEKSSNYWSKEKGVVFSNVEEFARPTTNLPTIDPKDKRQRHYARA